jgi:hypothetical protein
MHVFANIVHSVVERLCVEMTLKNHPQGLHACRVCHYKVNRLDNLTRHAKNVHGIISKSICLYCSINNNNNADAYEKMDSASNIEEDSIQESDTYSQDSDSDISDNQSDSDDDPSEHNIDSYSDENIYFGDDSLWTDFRDKAMTELFPQKDLHQLGLEEKKELIQHIKHLYSNLVNKQKILEKDQIHQRILTSKRKFEEVDTDIEEDEAWKRAYKKQRTEIQQAAFNSIAEEQDEEDMEVDEEVQSVDDDDKKEGEDTKTYLQRISMETNIENLWEMFMEAALEELHPDIEDIQSKNFTEEETQDIMKYIKGSYIALRELCKRLQSDYTHRRITMTKEAILKDQHDKCDNHEMQHDECIEEDEAQDMALNERIFLLMKVLFGKSTDDDDSISIDSLSSNISSDDEDTEDLFVSIFKDIITEQYPDTQLSEATQEVMSDATKMESILKLVRKKYLKLIQFKEKLDKQFSNSSTHRSINNTTLDYDSDDDDGSLDHVELTSAEKWKKAITKRRFAIKNDIVKNLEEVDDTDTDEDVEEVAEEVETAVETPRPRLCRQNAFYHKYEGADDAIQQWLRKQDDIYHRFSYSNGSDKQDSIDVEEED